MHQTPVSGFIHRDIPAFFGWNIVIGGLLSPLFEFVIYFPNSGPRAKVYETQRAKAPG